MQNPFILIFWMLPHDFLDIIEEMMIIVFDKILVNYRSFAFDIDVIFEWRN